MIVLPEIYFLCGHADISCILMTNIHLIRMILAGCVLICNSCPSVRLMIVPFFYLRTDGHPL